MADLRKYFVQLTPIQFLVIGYAAIVLIIAALLSLPISSSKGTFQPFLDALFVAASGISTSGLSVVDIGSYYSFFGQIVLLVDFQIGGIGYMTFFAFIAYVLNRRLSLKRALTVTESLAGPTLGDLKRFFGIVVIYTFLFELAGAIILALCWMREFTLSKAFYFGVFHSISTFCTAGFGLLSNSLVPYKEDLTVNLVIDLLSLAGGIGFFVLHDIFSLNHKTVRQESRARLLVHSKLALAVTLIVVLLGTVVILIAEKWPHSMSFGDRFMISAFQSISASTTDGYNSVDIGAMCSTSLFMMIVLMFVGASPGSTGGGIKTTTLGVMVMSLRSMLKGRREVEVFKRSISEEVVRKAFVIFLFFVLVMVIDTLILAGTEKAAFLPVLFEIVSALGNTGLSMGITANLTGIAKVILTITMFIGRVGPLTIGFALIGKVKAGAYKYAEGEVFVG